MFSRLLTTSKPWARSNACTSRKTWAVAALIARMMSALSMLDNIPPTASSTSWEISSDYTYYKFNLAKNVTWHDGVPFTAEDVKFHFELAMATPTSIIGSRFNNHLENITIIDDYTIEFKFNESLPPYDCFLDFHADSFKGKVISTVAPFNGRLLISRLPPCALIMFDTIARPSPLPLALVV